MKQSKFDIVMDYIDENIQENFETIKKGIYNLIGINSNTFGTYFTFQTGDTLYNYYRNRRLYYSAMELMRSPNKPICDIALEYGYSEQSAFTRAITAKYKASPNEIRNSYEVDIPNEKYLYSDFDPNPSDARSDRLWREFERTGYISPANIDFLEDIHHCHKEYHLDLDTCYAIADLAERLELPVTVLIQECVTLMAEVHSDPRYISDRNQVAMDLGIHTHDDIERICLYYKCKYYDLNSWMVRNYYQVQD